MEYDILPGQLVWAKVPGCRCHWPVQVVGVGQTKLTVFVHSDTAELVVSRSTVVPFKDNHKQLMKAGIASLAKKPQTLVCFQEDIQWCIQQAENVTVVTTANSSAVSKESHGTLSVIEQQGDKSAVCDNAADTMEMNVSLEANPDVQFGTKNNDTDIATVMEDMVPESPQSHSHGTLGVIDIAAVMEGMVAESPQAHGTLSVIEQQGDQSEVGDNATDTMKMIVTPEANSDVGIGTKNKDTDIVAVMEDLVPESPQSHSHGTLSVIDIAAVMEGMVAESPQAHGTLSVIEQQGDQSEVGDNATDTMEMIVTPEANPDVAIGTKNKDTDIAAVMEDIVPKSPQSHSHGTLSVIDIAAVMEGMVAEWPQSHGTLNVIEQQGDQSEVGDNATDTMEMMVTPEANPDVAIGTKNKDTDIVAVMEGMVAESPQAHGTLSVIEQQGDKSAVSDNATDTMEMIVTPEANPDVAIGTKNKDTDIVAVIEGIVAESPQCTELVTMEYVSTKISEESQMPDEQLQHGEVSTKCVSGSSTEADSMILDEVMVKSNLQETRSVGKEAQGEALLMARSASAAPQKKRAHAETLSGVDAACSLHQDDSDSDVPDPEYAMKDLERPKIYIRKVLKLAQKETGQHKIGTRVYNSYHACFFCGRLVQHIPVHMKVHKETEPEVQKMFEQEKPNFDSLRRRGDSKHNCTVLEDGRGEILLSRRPTDEFSVEKYGPCPECHEWLVMDSLKKHYIRCHSEEYETEKPSSRQMRIASDIMCQRQVQRGSSLLHKEVLPIMRRDEITEVAQGDQLIIALGDSWLRRNFDNVEKRKYYASERMRLASRLLLNLRRLDAESDKPIGGTTLWDFLTPKAFDLVVHAALDCAVPYMDDESDLRSPSNAIKLKYDITRLVSAKRAYLIKEDRHDTPEAKACKSFLWLMSHEWAERVTKLARTVLLTRSYEKGQEIPVPEDIRDLTTYLVKELRTIDLLKNDSATYQRVVMLAQARLLLYNKRRAGEIEVIRLKTYAKRTSDLTDVDKSIAGDLTEMEKYLLESQELMMVRGKRGRPVPVLIPPEAVAALDYLADSDVRIEAGIRRKSPYLFPNTGRSFQRAYGSLKAVCGDCSLTAPGRITSITLRKYMATLTQMMNLAPHQLQWVCSHLGHTKRIHLEHYRQMSGFVERVHLSKLLLIQDMNLIQKFVGKKLEDIDISEIVQTAQGEDVTDEGSTSTALATTTREVETVVATRETTPEETSQRRSRRLQPLATVTCGDTDSELPSLSETESEDEEREKSRKKVPAVRVKWTQEEESELQKYFKDCFTEKCTPGRQQVEKALAESAKAKGSLHKRYWHTVVKKISAMNKKK